MRKRAFSLQRVSGKNSDFANVPQISPWLWRLFGNYCQWYLRRAFHTIRRNCTQALNVPLENPLIIFLNHPSWWDPLLCLFLARSYFSERNHYAPMELLALNRYSFFTRLGFFGVEQGTRRGAVTFLRTSEAILCRPGSTLWVTPQGKFTDPRVRPVQLRPGLGALASRLPQAIFIPLALEYPFWEERFPEVVFRFGAPVHLEACSQRSAREWTAYFARILENTQDSLAQESCRRHSGAFDTLLEGRVGVGGFYDLWRSMRARLQGEVFQRGHSTEGR